MIARPDASLPQSYFDAVYAADADPWRFETSPYEAQKYRSTVLSLDGRRYARALEVGCSIGVLTALLAPLCDRLVAVDVSQKALQLARARCASLPQVRFCQMAVPAEFPSGSFDLVLTSEVAYYWSRDDLDRAAATIERRLPPGGRWLLVHWTPVVADYPLTGDEVHERILDRFTSSGRLIHVFGSRDLTYRLDLLERPGDAARGQ